ncbi:hypothetical protein CU044_3846 [Streptomyces sp. L-9-10]|uniref:hypothetical protein n=1 Tax=Streptomyces sp. L-9-10 TaxID=1478131 RepID=UPI00101B62F2|nr:hypothetical protein [Streptomyces sp. L-9-10]RYJ26135.1 hypothetical protein CU044_3846 [Streptomyces sp. L-9-10]
MSGSGIGEEMGAQGARVRALAVLRIRSRALGVAVLPAAVAVVLLVGGATGRISGGGWDIARWAVTGVALIVLLLAGAVAAVVARARPALSPTVPVSEKAAPDLYRLVRDLAERLDVPAPSAIALTPDCDSWLEDRTHPAQAEALSGTHSDAYTHPRALSGFGGGRRRAARRIAAAPVLVIGSPFLWWMRVAELRAVLAPVVAGTGPSAHPDIAAARRFVRGLDAAVAVASRPGLGPIRRVALGFVGQVAKLLLRGCGEHAALMERGVAAAASERAQAVDYGLRIVAQEQVGLAYAGWDRLLTRVALPAWRMGRWPSRLDAGVVSALTELSRRDRLAEGFTSRLGERPACDLLEEPGVVDEAASLLAARLFHGGPAEAGPDWSPVDWQQYPEEVVDRKWRTEAARLHRVLDAMGVRRSADPAGSALTPGPTLERVIDHLSRHDAGTGVTGSTRHVSGGSGGSGGSGCGGSSGTSPVKSASEGGKTSGTGEANETGKTSSEANETSKTHEPSKTEEPSKANETSKPSKTSKPSRISETNKINEAIEAGDALAAGISAELAREEAAAAPAVPAEAASDAVALWGTDPLPLFPLQPPRSGRELLADHVTAMVCCSAVDTAGAVPGLDWLDGPALLIDGERRADLGGRVLSLVEGGDAEPLRSWLTSLGVRAEKPVRLV